MAAALGGDDGGLAGPGGPVRACAEGASVQLRVVPGARRTELLPGAGAALRLRVAAPPVEGKANEAVVAFVAGALGVRPRALRLASGERSRDKVVVVPGMAPDEVAAALRAAMRGSSPDAGAGRGEA
jgi:uncharacterized protein (TIGR00251 family)